jgi:Fe-S-cluster-containing dehydrogenase component
MFKRVDGIVDFDKSICIGCKACMAACPYDAIFINPEDHSAEKCNFCAHRIDVGLEPACVIVCPTQAILVGDMNDSDSYVAQIINRESVAVRRPEKETLPKLFTKARIRRRLIRSQRDARTVGFSCGANSSTRRKPSFPGIQITTTLRRRRCFRTTWRIRFRGTGA